MLLGPDGQPLAAASSPPPEASPDAPADPAPADGAEPIDPVAALLAEPARLDALRAVLRQLGVEVVKARQQGAANATVPLTLWNAVLWVAASAVDTALEAEAASRDGILAPLPSSISASHLDAIGHLAALLCPVRRAVEPATTEQTLALTAGARLGGQTGRSRT